MSTTQITTVRHEVEVDRRIAAASAALSRAERSVEFARKFNRHLDEAEADHAQAIEAFREVAKEYEGWSRFFLVSGGHIHSSTRCHTIRITTDVGWLPDLSGLTEADAVEEHGEILCSHCYPTAPVAWTCGVSKQSIADKALKTIAKTPEGKAAVKASRAVEALKSRIDYDRSNVEWLTGRIETADDRDDPARVREWQDRLNTTKGRLAKSEGRLHRLEVAEAEANAALLAALNA